MMRRLLIALLVFWEVGGLSAGFSPSAAEPAGFSSRSIEGLPFLAVPERGPEVKNRGGIRGLPFAAVDIDGDGVDELVVSESAGLLLRGYRNRESTIIRQFNLPPEYTEGDQPADLLPFDYDNDGSEEVVVVAPSRDGSHWRVWIVDMREVRSIAAIDLPVFAERRFDGHWDGSYLPLAALNVPGRKYPVLVMLCIVLHDVHGRGALAVDPVQGEVLWHHMVDAPPHPRTWAIADLDGDDHQEVIISVTPTNNLNGQKLYDYGDDASRIHVINDDGTERFSVRVGGLNTFAHFAVLDLDDGRGQAVVTASSGSINEAPALAIWDPSGECRGRQEFEGRRIGSLESFQAGPGEKPGLAARFANESVEILRWQGDLFTTECTLPIGLRHNFIRVVDIIKEVAGEEVVIAGNGRVSVFDRSLHPLAGLYTADEDLGRPLFIFDAAVGRRAITVADGSTRPVSFVPAPKSYRRMWIAGGSCLALGAAGLVWRRRRDRFKVETDSGILRELRLQLLSRLAKGSHERIGALQVLRRLVWRLEAAATIAVDPDTPVDNWMPDPDLSAVIHEFRYESLARLREIGTLGRRTGVASHLVETCDEVFNDLGVLLDEYLEGNLSVYNTVALHTQATALAMEAESALQRIRHAVKLKFVSNLNVVLNRVLAAQKDLIEAAGVEVVRPVGPQAESVNVGIDAQDLEFVLDNLVGNAIRAMRDAPQRRLIVEWETRFKSVVVKVADTGWGIAPEDRETIFLAKETKRTGGGYGLPRSRKELAIYGGSLTIADSRPGHGTQFELVVPQACADDETPAGH